jgi:chromosome segregation ATPase
MCHEKLQVKLGPLINFIVGENGSGKSAVLTALTLCLGGKASDTNRGGSLRSFIKEGREHSSIIVQIKNAGSDAYQPDIYGESIIVERHFSKAGSSGFKIKSATGRTISNKKQEVDSISEWFALQMGNPLTVLSQDNARQFLNSSSPAQKYRYFVSGVQLEQLDNDYKLSQDTLERMELLKQDMMEKSETLKKELADAMRLSDAAAKNNSLRERARIHRHQLSWCQVVQEEEKLHNLENNIQEREEHITACAEDCEKMSKALEEVETIIQRLVQSRQDLDTERDGFEDIIASAEAVYDEAKKELAELQLEERDAHGRLKTASNEIKSWEEKIKAEERRLSESSGPERAQKDLELNAAQVQERTLTEQLNALIQERPGLNSQWSSAEEILKKCVKAKQDKRSEVVSAEKRAGELQQSTGSPFDGFPPEISRLVKEVERDQSFSHKPIGPLGVHIRISKPEWSAILERSFGEALNAFVVRSKQDQSKLANLMRRMKMKKQPPIYIAYGGHIDTAAQEPDSKFDTILRILEFNNDLVRAQMVINFSIEKIILVKDRVEAEKIMIDGDQAPRNVSACLSFHDGQGKRGYGLRLTNRNGTAATSTIKPSPERPRMQSDTGRQLELQKEQVKQLGLELRDITNEERQAKQTVQRHSSLIDKNKEEIKRLNTELRQSQAEIERISMDLDAFDGVDGRLETLRSELASKHGEAEQLGKQYGAMALAKRDLHAKVREAKDSFDAAKAQREDHQSRVNKADTKLQNYSQQKRIAVAKKNTAFERLDIEKNERRRALEKRERQRVTVEEFTREATAIVPERVFIPEGETYDSISAKYESIRQQLKERQRHLGASDEVIHARAEEARVKYEEAERDAEGVEQVNVTLKKAIEARLHRWRHFQRQISARVRIQFIYLLSERGFRGKIIFDHKEKTVNLHVEPDETRKSSAGRSTKTLSGGEKSFSSICMLLSIWEAIASPIRCLDEFDVFMDNVNRAISTNMLVSCEFTS